MRKDIFAIVILLLLTYFFWRHIPNLQMIGEGFIYIYMYKYTVIPPVFDVFAKASFPVLSDWFKEQMHLYMWFLLLVMIWIDITLYILVKVVTKSILTAFFVSLIFGLSFIGNFDIYSDGGYHYVLQRAIVLAPQLLGLMFLILYFNNFKFKFYFLALTFYFLGLWMGFFGTWFLPPFIFYPLFYLAFNIKKLKAILYKTIWTPLPFIIGNFLLIKGSFSNDEHSLLAFVLSHTKFVVIAILQQLTVITLPVEDFFISISKPLTFIRKRVPLQDPIDPMLIWTYYGLLLSTLILYLGTLFLIWRLQRKLIILATTSFASIIGMLLFNVYINEANVLFSFGSSRYFYFPFVFVAIFWGIFLSSIFHLKNSFFKLFVALSIISWVILNYVNIQKALTRQKWNHDANREAISILRSWSDQLKKEPSYVYLPSSLGAYGAEFVKRYYSHPQGEFRLESLQPIDYDELAEKKVNPDRVYVLHFDIASQKIIDQTIEARSKLRSKQLQTID